MRVVAALCQDPRAVEIINEAEYPNVLCAFISRKSYDRLTYDPDFVIIDSGAYSAWTTGEEIVLKDYAKFCVEVRARWPHAHIVNLDVIPGTPSVDPSNEEKAVAQQRSIANADQLRDAGLDPIEVFHQDEPIDFLHQLIERLPEGGILGLSPRNDVSMKQRSQWLASLGPIFSRQTELVRTHCFGAATMRLWNTFPFYSADSTTWCIAYRFGSCVSEDGMRAMHVDRLKLPGKGENENFVVRQGLKGYAALERNVNSLWQRRLPLPPIFRDGSCFPSRSS